jgi:hypothetical protein
MFGIDKYTHGKFGLTVASVVLTGTAVGLRIFIKIWHKQGIRADDYWIVFALCWFWASCGIDFWGLSFSMLRCYYMLRADSPRQLDWQRRVGDVRVRSDGTQEPQGAEGLSKLL